MQSSAMTYNQWIELADEYYLAARSLQWFTGLSYPTTLVGHHALELYFKAIMVDKTGSYDNRQHDLKQLFKKAVELKPEIDNKEVKRAVELYWNYDQPSRYTTKETKQSKLPLNNSMGTNSLRSLDKAVAILRDLSVVTHKGLDRIIEGETNLTKMHLQDHHLYLHSVILFHLNNSFDPKKPENISKVRYSAPTWNDTN